MEKIEILTPKDIIRDYNLPMKTAYEILHSKGCPILTGGKGRHIRIVRSEFERFITEGRRK